MVTVSVVPVHRQDPTEMAPVGCYLTDGHRLAQVLEVNSSGALGEDLMTELQIGRAHV